MQFKCDLTIKFSGAWNILAREISTNSMANMHLDQQQQPPTKEYHQVYEA